MSTEPVPTDWWLNTDVTSTADPSCIYGRLGEKVTVISEHGNVWVVQGEKDIRFSVNQSKLTNVPVLNKDSAPAKAPLKQTGPSNKKASRKKGKQEQVTQNTMF